MRWNVIINPNRYVIERRQYIPGYINIYSSAYLNNDRNVWKIWDDIKMATRFNLKDVLKEIVYINQEWEEPNTFFKIEEIKP